jgi:signal transduction histidine kinase
MGASNARATLIRFAVVMIVYATAAWVGLAFASIGEAVSLIWAPAGIGLAAVLRWGPGMAAAVGAGNLLVGLLAGHPLGFTVWVATGGALEALVGATLMTRVGRFEGFLESTRDVLALMILGCVVSAGLAGAFGATGLVVNGMVPGDKWVLTALRWWIGDGMGILIVAPVVIAWPRQWLPRVSGKRAAEGAMLALLLTLTGLVVFNSGWLQAPAAPLAYLMIPGVLWAAYRFRPIGAALASLSVAAFAVPGTLMEAGPFIAGSQDGSLGLMLGYLGVVSFSGLVVAALIATRDRSERALRDNQSWLGLIKRTAGVFTWVWDPEANTLKGSEQHDRVSGLDSGPRTFRLDDISRLVIEEDRERVRAAVLTAFETRGALDVEFRSVWPDGSVHWHLSVGQCIPKNPSQPDGPIRMVGMNLDTTQRKHIDESLRQNERLASLGTLAAGTAHEINNPLGTILLAARTAQQASDDPETVRTALEDIVEDTQRTARIVKNLLHFARSGDSARSPQDLNESIRRAAALTRPYGAQHSIALDLDLSDQPLWVSGNATGLEQVFLNLIRNAIESSSEGARVALESYQSGDQIVASVTDRGCGISEVTRPRIFDPFFTTRSSKGGTGLGLSICHGIAHSHGGSLEVASQPGVGTTLSLTLPAANGDEGRSQS